MTETVFVETDVFIHVRLTSACKANPIANHSSWEYARASLTLPATQPSFP